MSEIAAIIGAIWPILLAKMEVRLGVVEEKVRSLFDLWSSK